MSVYPVLHLSSLSSNHVAQHSTIAISSSVLFSLELTLFSELPFLFSFLILTIIVLNSNISNSLSLCNNPILMDTDPSLLSLRNQKGQTYFEVLNILLFFFCFVYFSHLFIFIVSHLR